MMKCDNSLSFLKKIKITRNWPTRVGCAHKEEEFTLLGNKTNALK